MNTAQFTAPWKYVKRQRRVVIAKGIRIAGMVAELSRTDPRSRRAIDLRRKLAKARYQLSIMTP